MWSEWRENLGSKNEANLGAKILRANLIPSLAYSHEDRGSQSIKINKYSKSVKFRPKPIDPKEEFPEKSP